MNSKTKKILGISLTAGLGIIAAGLIFSFYKKKKFSAADPMKDADVESISTNPDIEGISFDGNSTVYDY